MAGYGIILAFSKGRCKPYTQSPREQDIVRELIGSVKPRKRADLFVCRAEAVRRRRIHPRTRNSICKRCKAVVSRNVRNFVRRYLAEKCIRTSSLSIPYKAISRPLLKYEREVFFFSFRLPSGAQHGTRTNPILVKCNETREHKQHGQTRKET